MTNLLPRVSERILLRRLRVADLDDFQAYRTDPEVARYQGWEPMDDAEAVVFLHDMNTAPLLQPGEWCQIGIAQPTNGMLIGDIGICVTEDATQAEIGFSLSLDWQGQGLASEAVREALRFVVENSPVKRVVGITDARNQPSMRLLERVGMQKIDSMETEFRGAACVEYLYMIARDAVV